MSLSHDILTCERSAIIKILDNIFDPEIPVLSINDLGIVRDVVVKENKKCIDVYITPTYSGCPAMEVISSRIRYALRQQGYETVNVVKVLSPAWTTDWISEEGKQKLKAFGIAPPGKRQRDELELFGSTPMVQCPLCNSTNTSMISEFGSTSCKSLFRCNDCKEPFDLFKCH